MSQLLYATADQVGKENHGAGSVTNNELLALQSLGCSSVFSRTEHTAKQVDQYGGGDPWGWDNLYLAFAKRLATPPKLAHFYAGTFSKTVRYLREHGCKVTYTAAAHDIRLSQQAHEALGVHFNYPHLTSPVLWEMYVRGYLEADVLIVPSTHSQQVMAGFGAKNRIEVIPHGINLPSETVPPPAKFTIGYLGSYAPDKGVRYLLEAWKRLNYSDAELVLAGRDSTSDWTKALIQRFGGDGRNIQLTGWMDDVSDFYDDISLYIQPSYTEGFGIEVLEACAHSRPVLSSMGAGAADVLPDWFRVPAGDVERLAGKIEEIRVSRTDAAVNWRSIAENHTWDKVREKYIDVWKSLLS